MFPGPTLRTVTNHVLHIKVTNLLDEPLLFTWNGIQLRKRSWEDGVSGTNCPILPNQTWLYEFQVKDQIGSFFYYASLNYQRAAGGYGGIAVANRSVILVPFPAPADDFTILIGDWYLGDFKDLRTMLRRGMDIGAPDGVLINGKGPYSPGSSLGFAKFTVQQGSTYRLRLSNVGSCSSINFRIQKHRLLLVETEGSYTAQQFYDSLDIHTGQTYSVLVKADQVPGSFYMVASTKFSSKVLNGVGVWQYASSRALPGGPLPAGPDANDVNFSIAQARSILWNLTAGAARPNAQGTYKYGLINITRSIRLASSSLRLNGTLHYAVNGQSYLTPDTPLKLADYFEIPGVFTLGSMPDAPIAQAKFATSVLSLEYRGFLEIVFVNTENEMQYWHIDGYSAFVVGYGFNEQWSCASKRAYNMKDAVSRSTIQVYPKGWTAIFMSLDNVGMWNIRSQCLRRQLLGQELYFRVFNPENSTNTEVPIPKNTILCGRAVGKTIPSQVLI